MTHHEALMISSTHLLTLATARYNLTGYSFTPLNAHEGGRNLLYLCQKEGAEDRILRIIFLKDRSREDVLAEVAFIRYLSDHGASVANVITSSDGKLMEEGIHNDHTFFLCLFDKAKGKRLSDNHYRYRGGAPLSEYFYNCGKVLGKLHQLSKSYLPVHKRYGFFDKYNMPYIQSLLPDFLAHLKPMLSRLLDTLTALAQDSASYGMVHFDYSDGNYHIDFDNGDITVYDFDNACFCWYMYDLATLWTHGVGWVQFEEDPLRRKAFMDDYFQTVLSGYRTQTPLDDAMLKQLPLFIKVTHMENIVDALECMQRDGGVPECDENLAYLIKCLEDDIPYSGFFHDIYSCQAPFEYTPIM